jgi:hypothetical protein
MKGKEFIHQVASAEMPDMEQIRCACLNSGEVQAKRKHGALLKRLAPVAACFAIIAAVAIAYPHFQTKPEVSPQGIDMALSPRLRYNDSVFISESGDRYILPPGFTLVGEITGTADVNSLEDFQSHFVKIGSEIYANADKPDAIYIHYKNTDADEFQLFVTQKLHDDWLKYDGKLYRNISGVRGWFFELPEGSAIVGNVNNVVLDEIPTVDFQSNIRTSENAEVFKNGDSLYVQLHDQFPEYYLKLSLVE